MPTERYLSQVREVVANSLSECVLEFWKADSLEADFLPLPVRRLMIGQPFTQGLPFPIKFSFVVTEINEPSSSGKLYQVIWHLTRTSSPSLPIWLLTEAPQNQIDRAIADC